MSSFIVTDHTVDHVLHGITLLKYEMRDFAGFDVRGDGSLSIIGAALLAENHNATYIANRGHEKPLTVDELRQITPYTYKRPAGGSLVKSYKAAQCLQYQCDEGPRGPVLLALHYLIGALADQIIRYTPDYIATPWDFAERARSNAIQFTA